MTTKIYNHKTNTFDELPDDKANKVTNYYVPGKHSHCGDEIVYELDRDGETLEFTIASSSGATMGAQDADVILDLAHNFQGRLVEDAPPEFMELNQYVKQSAKVVQLNWPDYSSVQATLDFWINMVNLFPKSGRVMICCVGGHGRSGTAMAAILVALGARSSEAIKYVRGAHCAKAVENTTQENYLLSLSMEARARKMPVLDLPTLLPKVPNDMYSHCVGCRRKFTELSEFDTCDECWLKEHEDAGVA